MRPQHLVGLVALSLIWGASYLLVAIALDEMGPVAIGWVRMGGGSLLIAAVVFHRRARWPHHWREWAWIGFIATFASAVPVMLIPWGQQYIDSGITAVLIGSMPLWVAILATALLPAERLTSMRAVGVVLGFVGVVLVIGPDASEVGLGGLQGQAAILGAAFCYALGAVLVRVRRVQVESTVLAGAQALLAFVIVTPFAIAEGIPNPTALSPIVIFAAAMLAFGASGIGFLIYYWLLSNVGATKASMVTYLIPVSALGWGAWILDERIALLAVPGLVLILVGIVLVNRPAARSHGPAVPEPAVEVYRTDTR